jgi:hypothetical protein
MQYTHPFPLKVYTKIQSFVLDYMSKYNEYPMYVEEVSLPEDLQKELQAELAEYNLPNNVHLLVFKRKNQVKPDRLSTHIDFSYKHRRQFKSSIILPIENCQGTMMYWMEGDYTTIERFGKNYGWQVVQWNKEPTLAYQQEILEPTICRVDVPHSACSNADGTYRTILSIRLIDNPSFDDVLLKRFGNNSVSNRL